MLTLTSRQIRPPIYSLKQSRLRKRRVIRYAMLYFVMLIIFVVLIIGPIVARKYIANLGSSLPLELMQPTGQNNNDTHNSLKTGNFINGMTSGGVATATAAAGTGGGGATTSAADSTGTDNPFASLGLTGRALLPLATALVA